MKKPACVDVIIPTYNGLPYLKETVDSVLLQTYKNFRLLIIDDGSTDGGATEKYVKNLTDPRVSYYHKKNGGQATARNYGFKISSSPYVCFLDSDDLWSSDKLARQVEFLEKNRDFGMVYGYHTLFNEKGEEIGRIHHNLEGHLYEHLLDGNKVSGSASMVMIRRSVVDEVGLFREDFLIGEDWEMWLRVARKYQIGCIHDYIARLRALPEGMQKNYLKMARGLDYMLPIMLKEFKPNFIGRARLRGACLYDASIYHFLGGNQKMARRDFIKVLFYNPSKIKRRRDLVFVYIRILFGNNILRFLRRYASPGYRKREREYFLAQQKKGGF